MSSPEDPDADPEPDPSAHPPARRDPSDHPPARRGLGAVGRTVLLGVGVVAAFFVGLAAVALFAGKDRGPEPAAVGDGGEPAEVADASRLEDRDEPDTLPEATLEGFGDEAPVEMADYAGRPLVVNFWATWCTPCVEEMPDLQRVHEQVGDEVTFLGINVRDAPSKAEPFVEELGITYDLAVDSEGDYYREVGSMGMPTTLLVAPDGRIVARRVGAVTAAELRELLAGELGVRP